MDMFMILELHYLEELVSRWFIFKFNRLVKILQLYLNKGEYNSQSIFKVNTIDLFTSAPFKENKIEGVFFLINLVLIQIS